MSVKTESSDVKGGIDTSRGQPLSEVSAVGFKYVIQSKDRCQQILWVVVLILGFVGVFLHCFFLTKTYMSFPTVDVLSQKNVENEFPSVTICNNKPISHVNFRRHINMSDPSKKQVVDLYNENKDTYLFSTLGTKLSEKIGHQFSDVVLLCKFMYDKRCRSTVQYNWKLHQSTRSFNCFTLTITKETMQQYSERNEKEFTLIVYNELQAARGGPPRIFSHGFDSNNLLRITFHQAGQMPDTVYGTTPMQGGTNLLVNLAGKDKETYHFKVNSTQMCFAQCHKISALKIMLFCLQ